MLIVLKLITIALLLQLIDYLYHKNDANNVLRSSFTSFEQMQSSFVKLSCKKYDNIIGLFPWVWTYLYIASAVILFYLFKLWIFRVLLILFVAGRMRTLQEIGHFAIHGSLCPNKKLGMFFANILYQYPSFMPRAEDRRVIHCQIHHRSVNMKHDPDLIELLDKGLKPGITQIQFWYGVFFPLTPKGIIGRILQCSSYLTKISYFADYVMRLVSITIIASIFLYFGLYEAFIFLYLIPLLIVYPLYYWIVHLVLHRWFEPCDEQIIYKRELAVGRPTEFKGIIGFIIRHNIFPLGDSYHLAHSLFPTVRWNYLSCVDKLLKQHIPAYSDNISYNLFFSNGDLPSALSELNFRLCKLNKFSSNINGQIDY
jgi:fatty acid desaturase